jgi:hypothetical protein
MNKKGKEKLVSDSSNLSTQQTTPTYPKTKFRRLVPPEVIEEIGWRLVGGESISSAVGHYRHIMSVQNLVDYIRQYHPDIYELRRRYLTPEERMYIGENANSTAKVYELAQKYGVQIGYVTILRSYYLHNQKEKAAARAENKEGQNGEDKSPPRTKPRWRVKWVRVTNPFNKPKKTNKKKTKRPIKISKARKISTTAMSQLIPQSCDSYELKTSIKLTKKLQTPPTD